MSAPSFYASFEAYTRAEGYIKDDNCDGEGLRNAIELLLCNEMNDNVSIKKGKDAGKLLQKGLAALAKSPHQALGIDIGAKTQEIRKAYKKLALKYHPDKNPKTTPLFQAIQTASEKLIDPNQRKVEESLAQKKAKPSSNYQSQYTNASKPSFNPDKPPGSNSYPPNSYNNRDNTTSDAYKQFMKQQQQKYAAKSNSSFTNNFPDPQPPPRPSRFPQPSSGFDKNHKAGLNPDWDRRGAEQDYRKYMRDETEKMNKLAKDLEEGRRRKEEARRKMHVEAEELLKKKNEEESKRRQAEAYRVAQEKLKEAEKIAREKSNYSSVHKNHVPLPEPLSGADREAAAAAASIAARRAKYSKANPTATDKANDTNNSSNQQSEPNQNFYNYSQKYSYNMGPNKHENNSNESFMNGKNGNSKNQNVNVNVNANVNTEKTGNQPKLNPTLLSNEKKAFYDNKFNHMYNQSVNSAKNILPAPNSLVCKSVSYGSSPANAYDDIDRSSSKATIELEWKCPTQLSNGVSFEMKWRETSDIEWSISKKLIHSFSCRKKNLICGSSYDFKLRTLPKLESISSSIEPSPWSSSLTVHIPKSSAPVPVIPNDIPRSDHPGENIKEEIHRQPSVAEVYDDLSDNEAIGEEEIVDSEKEHVNPQNNESSSGIYKNNFRSNLKINTSSPSQGKADEFIDSSQPLPLSPVSKWQWSPKTAEKVLKKKPGLKLNQAARVIDFNDVNGFSSAADDPINLSFKKFNIESVEVCSGLWVNKKLTNEILYRKRYVWIDERSNRFYWAKTDNKSDGNNKFVDLNSDILEILVDQNNSAFTCVHKIKKQSICIQITNKSTNKPIFQDFVKVLKYICDLKTEEIRESDDEDILTDNNSDKSDKSDKKDKNRSKNITKKPPIKSEDTHNNIKVSPQIKASKNSYILNAPGESRDYQHPVRLAPDSSSPIGGYVVTGLKIEADVIENNWLLVRVHRRNVYKGINKGIEAPPTCKWGWSLISDSGHTYLYPIEPDVKIDTPPNASANANKNIPNLFQSSKLDPSKTTTKNENYSLDEFDIDDLDTNVIEPQLKSTITQNKSFSFTQRTPSKVFEKNSDTNLNDNLVYEWTQCTDEHGQIYYYNPHTMESKWEPPEWIEEVDPTSGASYYVKLNNDALPLHSTWSKPKSFARLLRTNDDHQETEYNGSSKKNEENVSYEEEYYEEAFEYEEDEDFLTEIACNKISK